MHAISSEEIFSHLLFLGFGWVEPESPCLHANMRFRRRVVYKDFQGMFPVIVYGDFCIHQSKTGGIKALNYVNLLLVSFQLFFGAYLNVVFFQELGKYTVAFNQIPGKSPIVNFSYPACWRVGF